MSTENNTQAPFLKKLTPFDKGGKPGKLIFILGNGHEVELDYASVREENKVHATYHGLSQKIGDALAGLSKNREYGVAADVLAEKIDQMYNGDWIAARQGGESVNSVADLIYAIAKVKKLKEVDVAKVVEAASTEERKTWRKHPAIDALIQERKLQRAKERAKAENDLDFPM